MSESEKFENEIMCDCSGTTRGKIYDLVMQGMSVDEISAWTGAKSGCGGCEWDIEEFVKALTDVQSDNPANTP